MTVLIRTVSDAHLLDAYSNYLKSDASNWTVGIGLLCEISRRFANRFKADRYHEGIARVVAIKPNIKGREEKFFPPDFAIPLPELKKLVAELTKDICLAATDNAVVKPIAGTVWYDVPIAANGAQHGQQVDAVLGAARSLFQDMRDQRILTFGSCFAVNLGRMLREKGFSVYTFVLSEDVNSAFNNRQLLRRVFLGEENRIADELIAISGLDYELVRQEFSNASAIVFTLGNVYHLELDGSPTLVARDGATLVSETVDQSVSYIGDILALLRRFTNAKIFTSVSPIPISGYRGSEFASAIEADCVSKSQLRAALHTCLKDFPDIRYIPTFEIFRWLPAHQSFPTFGVDDGNARHIAGSLLKRVLDAIAG